MSATSPPPLSLPADQPLPLMDPRTLQWVRDTEHLRILSIFHYIVGGLSILFSSLFIFHVIFGIMMISNSSFFDTLDNTSSSPAAVSPTPAESPADATPSPATVRPAHRHGNAPPRAFGYFVAGLGSFAVLLGWSMGAMLIYSGRCLARRTRRVFSMVVGGIACLQVPFGTILGVFTLVVLQRPSVLALYDSTNRRA